MKPIETATVERPLRADAARNRASVLAAARKTFAAEGLEAEMASIASRAGVGVGTVYRHFPTKDALLVALTADHFERLGDIAEACLAEGGEPWEVFERTIWRTAEHSAVDHGMCEILSQAPPSLVSSQAAGRLRELTGSIVRAAVKDGSARKDATIDDIPMMMCAFGKIAALEQSGLGPPNLSWKRYLRIMLDGMRR